MKQVEDGIWPRLLALGEQNRGSGRFLESLAKVLEFTKRHDAARPFRRTIARTEDRNACPEQRLLDGVCAYSARRCGNPSFCAGIGAVHVERGNAGL